jgi:isovaleryl-CoA dehydrogenase
MIPVPHFTRKPLPFETDVYNLGEEADALRAEVTRFATTEIEKLAAEAEEKAAFPQDLWERVGELGWLGISAPEEYGGTGGSYLYQVIVAEEISRASGGMGLSYIAHANLAMGQIARFGTEEQKQKYLPALCAGGIVGALAMSEAGAGSDVLGCMATTAKQDGADWILNGSKFWITNGPEAGVVVVYARTGEGKNDVTAFLVEKGAPGFTVSRKIDKTSMKCSNTAELVFDGCRVSGDAVLGGVNQGARVLMKGLDYERVVLSAGAAGIIQACIDVTHPYVCARKQFGRPLSDNQFVQGLMCDMDDALHSLRVDLYRAAQRLDRPHTPMMRPDASRLFRRAGEAVRIATGAAQDLMGGAGLTTEYPVDRYARDGQLYRTGGGTMEMRKIVHARHLITRAGGTPPKL